MKPIQEVVPSRVVISLFNCVHNANFVSQSLIKHYQNKRCQARKNIYLTQITYKRKLMFPGTAEKNSLYKQLARKIEAVKGGL